MSIELTPEQRLGMFKNIVDWADGCTINYFGKTPYAQADQLILFPVHWADVTQLMSCLQLPAIKALIGCNIGLIIDGDCPDYDCDQINHMLGVMGICPFWLMAKQRVRWGRWVLELSDGIDIIAEARRAAYE